MCATRVANAYHPTPHNRVTWLLHCVMQYQLAQRGMSASCMPARGVPDHTTQLLDIFHIYNLVCEKYQQLYLVPIINQYIDYMKNFLTFCAENEIFS